MKYGHQEYRKFLLYLKENRNFVNFNGPPKLAKPLILRHDVDLSLESVLPIAKIENELGIVSTYFIRIAGPYFNLIEDNNLKICRKLIELGHNLGLHAEIRNPDIEIPKIAQQILFQRELMQEILQQNIEVFSLHNPGNLRINFFDLKMYLNEFNFAYDELYYSKDRYFSDSNGKWRDPQRMQNAIESNPNLVQLLIHPEWWSSQYLEPDEILSNICILSCISNIEHHLANINSDYLLPNSYKFYRNLLGELESLIIRT